MHQLLPCSLAAIDATALMVRRPGLLKIRLSSICTDQDYVAEKEHKIPSVSAASTSSSLAAECTRFEAMLTPRFPMALCRHLHRALFVAMTLAWQCLWT